MKTAIYVGLVAMSILTFFILFTSGLTTGDEWRFWLMIPCVGLGACFGVLAIKKEAT